jgi:hypothetical protein
MQNSIPQDPSPRKKMCSTCKKWLTFSDFHAAKNHKDGLSYSCKVCVSNYQKNMSPEWLKNRSLRSIYGITLKKYNKMFLEQNGVCKICGYAETESNQHGIVPLSVDHDHKTGDVRALLCQKCNRALGQMQEDPERIKGLLAYAEWCQSREPDVKITQLRLLD